MHTYFEECIIWLLRSIVGTIYDEVSYQDIEMTAFVLMRDEICISYWNNIGSAHMLEW